MQHCLSKLSKKVYILPFVGKIMDVDTWGGALGAEAPSPKIFRFYIIHNIHSLVPRPISSFSMLHQLKSGRRRVMMIDVDMT